jgi:methoxymalonate biosynthesis acyl carrier protein
MMSDQMTTLDEVTRIFESMNLDAPPCDLDLFESGLLDSMAFVQLLLHLEETFGVTVAFEDLEIDNFRTVENIATVVRHRGPRLIAS